MRHASHRRTTARKNLLNTKPYRLESLEGRVLLAALTSTVPYNGQQNVAVAGNLSVTFASAMNASTLTSANVVLSDAAGNVINAALSYNATSRVLTVDPTSNLASSNTYLSLRVVGGTNGVRGTDNSTLAADYVVRFTTGAPTFTETAVFGGLNNPTTMEFAPDGRIFVAEKRGVIKVFDSLTDTTGDTFVDIRTNVHNFWDRGLLGLALDPQFTTGRPYVYVLYAYDGDINGNAPKWGTANTDSDPGDNTGSTTISGRLSRFTASGNVAVGGETVLVHDWQQQFPSHSIGEVNFGPDGYLYASGGDGASFNGVDYGQFGNPFGEPTNQGGAVRSQDILSPDDAQSLDGTVIRVDPNTGLAAPGNPFSSYASANAKRIIAHGLRNPFRFAFRPGTSEIWIAETGWNTYEEINRITNSSDGVSENFGWPAYEGPARQSGYDNANLPLLESLYAQGTGAVVSPWFAYAHSEKVVPGSSEPTGGSTPTGITFYTGSSYPAAYRDALFFTDFSRKQIYIMYRGVDGLPDISSRQIFRSLSNGAVDLMTGPDGNLYYIDLLGNRVVRVNYAGVSTSNDSLPGTVIGTTGSYNNSASTRDKAFDNDINTFFDAPVADGTWVGLDLGSSRWVRKIQFAPRDGFAARMVGGIFQGSNDPSFASGVVNLATVNSAPANGVFTTLDVNAAGASFRYVRFLSPNAGWGNVAEIKFYAGDGLAATYHNNIDYTGSTVSRVDKTIDFAWAVGTPDAAIGADTFSARWTGKIQAIESGTYTFRTTSDDGIRLWVNNQLLVDQFINQSATSHTGTINLTAGQIYDIRIDYFENAGDAVARLEWQRPGGAFQIVPMHSLFSVAANTNQPPVPTINSPTNALNWKVGDTISFSGTAFDAEDGSLTAASLNWTLVLIHANDIDPTNVHDHVVTSFAGVASGSFIAPDHEYPSWLELRLTATDSQGLAATQTLRLDPRTTLLNFTSLPAGLRIAFNGTEYTTPFSRTVITGSANSVAAISPQQIGSSSYGFVSWSNGGSQSQGITAPLDNTTFIATYATPPAAPTGLVATPLGTSQVQLSWVDASNNETQFVVERRVGATGSWIEAGMVGSNLTALVDIGLTAGTEYQYRVFAVNAAGRSAESNIATATTTSTSAAPATPSGLAATVLSGPQVRLNWADNATNEANYIVQRRYAGWIWEDLVTIGSNAVTHVDTTAIGNVVYEYRVAARNAVGTSAWSNPVTVNTANVGVQPPAAPSALLATPVSGTRIDLLWSDNSATEAGFYVERRLLGGTFQRIATTASNAAAFSDTTVAAGNTYEYRVIAFVDTVTSAASNKAVATTPGGVGVPNIPSNFQLAVQSNRSVVLNWTDNSTNETGFRIQRRYRGWIWEDLASVGPGLQTYTDAATFGGVVYEYRIVALGAGGNSQPTNAIEAVIP